MKEILNHLLAYKTLSKKEARQVLVDIAQGKYTAVQIAAFMTVYMMRSVTVEELEGFRDAMLELCVALDVADFDPMDVCGTGGDGKDTFNISTLSAFVIAGAGQAVVKHGNYGVSSICGSSTVMEYLGYKFTNDKGLINKSLEEANICFLHAPLFHPAMKNVAPVRKELGVKTFFNMLGPMVNPAFPKKQMVGVYSLEIARLYAYLYQRTDKSFSIVHALDGYDEISLTGDFKIIGNQAEKVFSPKDLNLQILQADEILGGNSVEESAKIFMNVLTNEATPAQKQAVLANAAFGLQTAKPELTVLEAVEMARESLEGGKALQSFQKLVA
ncbi:anthranilate phosphoribosyltransferase [Cytophagaceae bacterium DM2B3-1]|uniref:Anthranilate phosphoribosyltransferase n=1 Tax=Xanthocytophaga flava TaxID=3048013 RepID=A0ABT7CMV7_9BACT|nr:anthranilate phosphoribosyltransferase [Xanthocytophaga flavus]MDJ1469804.1 anthranilate phosphoribosyltransferase [Xanthocytophaga flavus]MDJ1494317.1 anthranilate phosphoribosyltransferase [Xanthocytophaga flavus]